MGLCLAGIRGDKSDKSDKRGKFPPGNSTDALFMSVRPGTILETAKKSEEYAKSLEKFHGKEPLDLSYASLHTYWLHESNIPLRALRLVRDQDGEQLCYMDEELIGTWQFKSPKWLGISRAGLGMAGDLRGWSRASRGSPGLVRAFCVQMMSDSL